MRQTTRFEPSIMKIGLSVWAVREPEKVIRRKRHQRYISRMRGGGTPGDGEMKLGTFVELMDIINHANFHLYLMTSFWASGGQK